MTILQFMVLTISNDEGYDLDKTSASNDQEFEYKIKPRRR